MSYDLAVWEGARPSNDEDASALYEELMDKLETGDFADPTPTPRIKAFVEALLAKWPDIDASDDSPWATGPLMDEAMGPFVHFPMVFSRADEASAFAASLAGERGLVCYDPQRGSLR